MFCEIDNILFPNDCEVLEIVPRNIYVYPIFKNGSSSLKELEKFSVVKNHEIRSIQSPITVFLRDPKQRFISGVNTYVRKIKQSNPELDQNTVLWCVKNYLFLNRHYMPQFFWLINLARYSTVPLNLESVNNINKYTPLHSRAGVEPPDSWLTTALADMDWKKLELYFYFDQLLIEKIGSLITFKELLNSIKTNQPDLYDLVFGHSKSLIDVLS